MILIDKVFYMKLNQYQNSEPWIDRDDAPEVTADDLKHGVWKIDGKIVSEAEGRTAFAKKLKEISGEAGKNKT